MAKIEGIQNISTMTDEQLDAALAEPVTSPVDIQSIQNDINDYKKYGDSELRTAAENAASGATFGLSDQAQIKLGLATKEDLRKRAEQNPISAGFGQAVGVVAPALLTGGESLAAKGLGTASEVANEARAAKLASQASEAMLKNVLKETANKKIVRDIVKKTLEKGVTGAVEGAAYGAGQLVHEDALGAADFNAENLLAYTGSGALIGGSLNSALPLLGAASTKLGKELGKGTEKIFSKYTDPVQDSAKLLGFSKSQIEKITSKNPEFFKGVPDFVREKLALKVGDSTEDLMIKNNAIKKAAGKEMDAVYDAMGDNTIDKSVFTGIANNLEEKYIKPYEGMESFKGAIVPAKNIVKDIRAVVSKSENLTAKEVRSLRQKMDELGASYYKARDPSKGAEAAFGARSLIRDELNAFVTQVNPNLGRRLAAANKDFHYAETISKAIDKKAITDKSLLDFKDYALGGIFGGLLGNAGLAIPAAKKLMESDFKRKVTVLAGMEKANKLVDTRIVDAAKSFMSNSRKAFNPVSIKIMMNSPLSFKEGKKPSNKTEAFNNIREKVLELRSNPEEFTNKVTKSIYSVSRAAPQAAQYMQDHSVRAFDFLNEKMPKDLNEMLGPKFMQKPFTPSSMEVSKFERYVQILEHPLSAMDELEQGTLTREHVEALEAVYPSIYSRMKVSIMDEIRNQPTMAYDKKIQLGILFDTPTDPSMIPENILALQSNFAPQEQGQSAPQPAVKTTQGGAENLSMSDRHATDVQANLERE
jgi:hypothetical protein